MRQFERATDWFLDAVVAVAEAEGYPDCMLPFTPMPSVPGDAIADEVCTALCNGDGAEDRTLIEQLVRDTLPAYDPEIHARWRTVLYYLLCHLFDHTGLHEPFIETEADMAPLEALQAESRSLVWAPNHTSNIDDPLVAAVCDQNGFGLPHFAAGANLMGAPFVERAMKSVNCLKILRKFDSASVAEAYKQVLALTCRGLTQREEDFIVFVEANNRSGARTRNGTLRLPDRLRVIEGIVDAEADAVMVPMAVSYSRVPEARKMVTGQGSLSVLRYTLPHPGPRCPTPAGARWSVRQFARLLGRYRNTYGKTCVTIGEPFSIKDLLTSEAATLNGDGARLVGEESMRRVSKAKKVLPAQIVAEAIEDFRELNMDMLTENVQREIDKVARFHEETYGTPANFSREFQGGPGDVIEAGLPMLTRTGIVRRRRWFTSRFTVRRRDEVAYYGNMADHRLFSADFRDKVGVIGAGRWGYTLCHLIGEQFLRSPKFRRHSIVIFDTRQEITDSIRQRRIHPHFSEGVEIPKIVYPKFSYKDAIEDAKCIIVATTSGRFREVLQHVGRYASRELDLVIATKGFDHDTYELMPQLARNILAEFYPPAPIHLFVLSGANIASEVIGGRPCASVLASSEPAYLPRVREYLEGPAFKLYTNTDPIGTALAGAAKNPYATLYACADALDLGQNFLGEISLLATQEIIRLAQAMGASARTFTEGHAWWPDFHATALGGRSSRFGKLLGQGWTAERILKRFAESNEAAETYHATKAVWTVAQRYDVDLPMVRLLYAMLYEAVPATPERFHALLLES